ncbi:MAG TPA: type II toxin-antitoxin system VapC family toxin [Thermoanaerobaculia bacterium]|nr:type II toxin-antitoxin system VapC family toxin [Thermoanaerobaculia bacterium]
MILVDTSVWVDHLRRSNSKLAALLEDGQVACHPFVIGELALGHLKRGSEVPDLLGELPSVTLADHHEVMAFVAAHALAGSGVGWVDAHLLCSAALSGVKLWTLDRPLLAVAERCGLRAA